MTMLKPVYEFNKSVFFAISMTMHIYRNEIFKTFFRITKKIFYLAGTSDKQNEFSF